MDWHFQRNTGEASSYQNVMGTDIAERFLKHIMPRSLIAGVALILIGIGVKRYDLVACSICVGFGLVVIAHGLLTQWRVDRGVFGSNSEEAIELISFVVNQTNKILGPPGSLPSRNFSPQSNVEVQPGDILPDARQ